MNSLLQSSTLPVLEQVVNFTQARHGVLAGNIANLDTPGYRTRDLSPQLFEEQLKKAVEASRIPRITGYQLPGSYGPPSSGLADKPSQLDAFREVEESLKSILYHDDSDVSLERQITEIAKNQAQHNLAVNIMAAQFRLLRAAIAERVI